MRRNYCNLTPIKTGLRPVSSYAINSKGEKKYLTSVHCQEAGISLMVLNDNYAAFIGYQDRADLLKQLDLLHLIAMDLYHNPINNKIYTVIRRLPVCLN